LRSRATASWPGKLTPPPSTPPSPLPFRSWDYAVAGVAGIEANYESIINASYVTHGTIVLSHELDNETMALSEQFLPAIREKFTGGVMPVGVCQNWTQIYGEGSGYEYPNYAQWTAGTRSIAVAVVTAYSSEVPLASASILTSSGLPAGSVTAAEITASVGSAIATSSTAVAGRSTHASTASTAATATATATAKGTGSASASASAGATTPAASGAAGGLRAPAGRAAAAAVAVLAGVLAGALLLA